MVSGKMHRRWSSFSHFLRCSPNLGEVALGVEQSRKEKFKIVLDGPLLFLSLSLSSSSSYLALHSLSLLRSTLWRRRRRRLIAVTSTVNKLHTYANAVLHSQMTNANFYAPATAANNCANANAKNLPPPQKKR